MTYLMFDIAIAALLLFAVWRGYQRGFVLTLCGFLAIFVALIGASVVSSAMAEPVSRTIQPIVEQHIQQLLDEQLPEGGLSVDAEDLPAIPLQEALDLLKNSDLYKGFANAFQEAVDSGMVAATASAARVIADYVAKQIAQIVLFLIAFVLILIVWFFISHALDLAFHLPVLSTLNRWSGAVLGLAKGALLVYIACWLLKDSVIPREAIGSTYLLNLFCTTTLQSLLS